MLKLLSILIISFFYQNVISGISNPELPKKVVYNLDNIDELFKGFINTYHKKYSSAEIHHRRKVFADNLIKINRLNRDQSGAVFGIGPFTDLSYEEFKNTYTGILGNYTVENAIKYEPKGMAPESLDWRQNNLVTRVKNQQRCGSCYIFSAIGNIEGQYAKQTGQLIELSEQQSLDCNSNGCGGGWPDAVMKGLVNSGCMRESDYPYEGREGQCRTNQNKIVVRVTGGNTLQVGSEENLKDALAQYGPLSIVHAVNEEWKQLRGGIFRPKTDCSRDLHAVVLVGYGSEGGVPYWLIKNSWGSQWNENGYIRLIRGERACNIGMYAASATVA